MFRKLCLIPAAAGLHLGGQTPRRTSADENVAPPSPNVPSFGLPPLDVDIGSPTSASPVRKTQPLNTPAPSSVSTAAPSSSSTPLTAPVTPFPPTPLPEDCPVCLEPLDDAPACCAFSCDRHRMHKHCFQGAAETLRPHLINVAALESHVEAWNELVEKRQTCRFQRFPLEVMENAKARSQNLLSCYECRAPMTSREENEVMQPFRESVGFMAKRFARDEFSDSDVAELTRLGVVRDSGTFEMANLGGEWRRADHFCIGVRPFECDCPAERAGQAVADLALSVEKQLMRELTLQYLNKYAPFGYSLPEGWEEEEAELFSCESCGGKEMKQLWNELRDNIRSELEPLAAAEHKRVVLLHGRLQLQKAKAQELGLERQAERFQEKLQELEDKHRDILFLNLRDMPPGSLEEDADGIEAAIEQLEDMAGAIGQVEDMVERRDFRVFEDNSPVSSIGRESDHLFGGVAVGDVTPSVNLSELDFQNADGLNDNSFEVEENSDAIQPRSRWGRGVVNLGPRPPSM